MRKTASVIGLIAVLVLPASADARKVTLRTSLKSYGGEGAYLAIYLTDTRGKFHSTLHVAGPKAKYHKHLRNWARGKRSKPRSIDGITGASVGSGKTLTVSVDIADALIDAGYQVRVDSSVEDQRDIAADVIGPLNKANAGKIMKGKGYLKTFSFTM